MPQPTKGPSVFISYARLDGRQLADQLYSQLKSAGFAPWRDERDIDPDQDFSSEIERAIQHCEHVVVCVTPAVALARDTFVRREVIYALACRKKAIIPLVFPGGEPVPVLINHYTYISFCDDVGALDFPAGFSQLTQRLSGKDRPELGSPTPVRARGRREEYLQALYEDVVSHLESTVFALLTLRASVVHDPGGDTAARRTRVLPFSFRTTLRLGHPIQAPTEFFSLSDALEYFERRAVLLGEPGAGKTTSLLTLARDAAVRSLEDPSEPLPIVARIADWPAEHQPALATWLAQESTLPEDLITAHLARGSVLLLLDGLDELSPEFVLRDSNRRVVERFDPRQRFLNILRASLGQNRLLLTCRREEWHALNSALRLGIVSLEPLSDSQIDQYLHSQPELLMLLRRDRELRRVARTPLLLAILAYAFRADDDPAAFGKGSDSAAELRDRVFEAYVRRRYEHEQTRTSAALPFSVDQTYRILGQAAAHMFWGFSEAKPRSGDQDTVDLPMDGATRAAFLEHARRLHIIIGPESRAQFIHGLLRDHFAFRFALAELPNVSSKMRAYRAGVWSTNGYVLDALRALPDPRSVEPLIQFLRHRRSVMCQDAIEALAATKDQRALNAILDVLEDADGRYRRIEIRNWAVRSTAALLVFGAIAVFLIWILVQPEPASTRTGVAALASHALFWLLKALLLLPLAYVVVVPLFVLFYTREHPIRTTAARACGVFDAERARVALESACSDRDAPVSRAAREALANWVYRQKPRAGQP